MFVFALFESELGSFNLEDCTACPAPYDVEIGVDIGIEIAIEIPRGQGTGCCGKRWSMSREVALEDISCVSFGIVVWFCFTGWHARGLNQSVEERYLYVLEIC